MSECSLVHEKIGTRPAEQSTQRICVMGNSHVAALKGGWSEGAPVRNDLELDFFGALSDGMFSLGLVDGKLEPLEPEAAIFFRNISGLGTGVSPEKYDAFILCGMGMFLTSVFKSYELFATPGTRKTDAPHFVSDACIHDLAWDQIDGSMMMHCARLVRSVTDKPVFLVWQAFWSETLFDIQWRRDQMKPILKNGDQAYIRTAMADTGGRLTDEGFAVLTQPEHTVADGVMTKAEFSRGSVRFRQSMDQKHRENDVFHMNSAYGRACWEAWLT